MKHGSPGAPPAMSSPLAKRGEPSTKNGPKTVDSVASGGRRLLSPTTSIESPRHVGEQDELLSLVVGDVAGAGEEVDAGEPLLLGQPDLGGEGVEVAHERLQDLAQARIGSAVEAGLDGLVSSASARLRRCGACVAGGSVTPRPSRGSPACQVPLHALARVGVQPAAERALELACQRQQRALVPRARR
jgi:hypothetical protein